MSMNLLPSQSEAIREALLIGDTEKATTATQEALARGADPLGSIQEATCPPSLRSGPFEEAEISCPSDWKPERPGAAGPDRSRADQQGRRNEAGPGSSSSVLVKGDIHDIGKNIVASLFKAQNFKVIDLGKDVPATRFLEAAEENHADLIAASALMSITRAGCR